MGRRRRRSTPPPVRKHPMKADKSVPADHAGNQWCVRCKHMGKPGDQRHSGEDEFPPDPLPRLSADERQVRDRMLGEAS